jgi:hypothetical protein
MKKLTPVPRKAEIDHSAELVTRRGREWLTEDNEEEDKECERTFDNQERIGEDRE